MPFIFSFKKSRGPDRKLFVDGNRLSYCDGGGIIDLLFGGIFLGLSCVPLYTLPLSVVGVFQGMFHPWWTFFIVFILTLTVGGTFAVVGGWMIFGREGTVIDRGAGVVESWWSLLFLRREKILPLAELNTVSVRPIQGPVFSTRYVVFLNGKGQETVDIATESEEKAEALAAEVRKFLVFPAAPS